MSDPGLEGRHAPTASPPSFLTAFPDNISGRVTPPTPTSGPTQEEFATLKGELASAQQALQEATDAREASETAVRALREFIAENAVGESKNVSGSSDGLQGLRLPPLPTDVDVADEEASAPPKSEEPKRGWGGWLKREPSNTVPKVTTHTSTPSIKSATEEEEAPAVSATSTPLTNFVSSWTKGVNTTNAGTSSSEPSPASPAVSQQPSGFRKFSLFGRSTPSTTPVPLPTSQPASQVQTQYEPEHEHEHEEPTKHVPPPLELSRDRTGSVRDSVSSASVSDAAEPVSPPAELVDVALDPSHAKKAQDEFAGERTPTVGSMTGFAM